MSAGAPRAYRPAAAAPHPARRPGVIRRPATLAPAMVNTVLALAALYTFFPLVWTLLAAGKTPSAVQSGNVLTLHDFSIVSNVRLLIHYEHGIYFRWLANSFIYAGVGGAVGAFICVSAGYAFDKYQFQGKEMLFGLVLVGVLVPQAATTLPLYLAASKVHLVNTYWSVLVPCLVNPFGVYLARVFSAAYVADEVLDAGRIDGAPELTIFRLIALPIVRPGYVTIFLFQFAGIWNGFYLPLVMLTNTHLFPASLAIYEINGSLQNYGPHLLPFVMLGSLVSILPLIVVFFSLQRFWKAGLTAGSVK
jgi:multiple sugar transport system permease protein